MIKTIYLHVGVHKTATSSIQESFGHGRAILASYGYLYPVFKRKNENLHNHSEVFYSLFTKYPEEYHINVLKGFNTKDLTNELHRSYKAQFILQLEKFAGENVILSGEDISMFGSNELKNLKDFLVGLTQPNVQIKIIMFCRNPISWACSHIQEVIKGGKTIAQAIEENNILPKPFYQTKINLLADVFQFDSIQVMQYEEAITHEYGPVGAFLSLIGADKTIAQLLKNDYYNQSPSYEATVLLHSINTQAPRFINNITNPALFNYRPTIVQTIPGQKYFLDSKQNATIWKRDQDDVLWLCKEFDLPEYKFIKTSKTKDSEKWNEEVMKSIKLMLPDQPLNIRLIIFKELTQEFNRYKHAFPNKKKFMLFTYFISYLPYIQVNTRFKKFEILSKHLGFYYTFKLSLIVNLWPYITQFKKSK